MERARRVNYVGDSMDSGDCFQSFSFLSDEDQENFIYSRGIRVMTSTVRNDLFCRNFSGFWLGGDVYARIDFEQNGDNSTTSCYLCSREKATDTNNFGIVDEDHLERGIIVNSAWVA